MTWWLDTMLTRYIVIPVIGGEILYETQVAPKPGYKALKALIEPYLEGEQLEHVAVLWEGERRDMFVGECSSINGRMIRNVRATAIYRNNTLTQNPGMDPESLPPICGPAVLFPHRRVWW